MLYFGALHKDEPVRVSENIVRLTRSNSTYAYALRETVFDAFIELNGRAEDVLDNNSFLLQRRFNCYCFMPHLAWVETDYSDAQQRLERHWYLKESLVLFGPRVDGLLADTTLVLAHHARDGARGEPEVPRRLLRLLLRAASRRRRRRAGRTAFPRSRDAAAAVRVRLPARRRRLRPRAMFRGGNRCLRSAAAVRHPLRQRHLFGDPRHPRQPADVRTPRRRDRLRPRLRLERRRLSASAPHEDHARHRHHEQHSRGRRACGLLSLPQTRGGRDDQRRGFGKTPHAPVVRAGRSAGTVPLPEPRAASAPGLSGYELSDARHAAKARSGSVSAGGPARRRWRQSASPRTRSSGLARAGTRLVT